LLPDTTTALLIAAVALVPGFVAQRRGEQTHNKRIEREGLRWTVLSLYYSAVTYAIVVTAATLLGGDRDSFRAWTEGDKQPWQYAVAGTGVLLLAYLVAEVERVWVTRDREQPWTNWRRFGWKTNKRHEITGAWDWILGQADPKFVIVSMKDGDDVGGYLGYDSFAAYSTEGAADVYLEEVIPVDKETRWFVDPGERVGSTAGIWIARDQIRSIEFYPASWPEDAVGTTAGADDQEDAGVQ